MTKKAIIRFVQKEDLSQLVVLCKQHAEFEKSTFESKGKQALLAKALFTEEPKLFCLVAEIDKNIIGYSTFMKQFSTWDANSYVYMDCLFLKEGARGYGIGEKLIERIKEKAKYLNCDLIQWQTPDFNKRAIKFYDRIGAKSKNKKRYVLDIL